MAIPREAVRWEAGSVPFVFVAGSLLHFAYDWLSRSFWMAPVAAIDESVWEHLKLAFWPAAAFAVVQATAMRSGVRNYVLGKAVGLSVAPLAIVAGFYGYTAILGYHALAADLALFVAAVTLGAAASLVVYALPDFGTPGRRAGFAAIIVWIASFASFTYNKPPFGLFQVDDESSNHEAVNDPRIGTVEGRPSTFDGLVKRRSAARLGFVNDVFEPWHGEWVADETQLAAKPRIGTAVPGPAANAFFSPSQEHSKVLRVFLR